MTKGNYQEIYRSTPFSLRTKALNESGRWASWNDYIMPEVFKEDGYDDEVQAVHHSAVIEDKSPLVKYFFTGLEVIDFIDYLIPRDVTRIKELHAVYTPICDHEGKMVMDGLLFRLDERTFCFTAGCIDEWLKQIAERFDVVIEDKSNDFGILHIQGPKSMDIIQQAFNNDLGDLKFSRGRKLNVAGVDLHIWRQGFTGELGFEIWVPTQDGVMVWDLLWNIGQEYGLTPFGHNSQDVARIEVGLIIPALDYTCACLNTEAKAHAYGCAESDFIASPFEFGLDRLVDLSKKDFVGKEALITEMKNGGPENRFVGIEIDPADIIKLYQKLNLPPEIKRRVHRFPILQIFRGGDFVGYGSSITWSPTLKKIIGFARVKRDFSENDANLMMEWKIKDHFSTISISITELPFLDIKRQ